MFRTASFPPPFLVLRALLATSLVVLASAPAFAHKRHKSTSRWLIRHEQGVVGVTLGFEGSDLQIAADLLTSPLPPPGDPTRRGEIERRVYSGLTKGLRVLSGGAPCTAVPLRLVRRKGYEPAFRFDCDGPITQLEIQLLFLQRLPSSHQHVGSFRYQGRNDVRRFGRERVHFRRDFPPPSGPAAQRRPDDSSELAPSPPPLVQEDPPSAEDEGEPLTGWTGFGATLREGVRHILSGLDHMLFLLALLLAGGGIGYVITVVTAFTVAHSLTLGVAFMGWWLPPERLVESGIALSIVWVAAANVWSESTRHRWIIVFAFGLLHGFGFAGFLADLPLARDSIALTLLAFNLGVEFGQLAIVIACVPVLMWLSSRMSEERYRGWIIVPGSALVGLAGGWWLVERMLG